MLGELAADTGSRTGTERFIDMLRQLAAALWCEAVRIELISIWAPDWVSMCGQIPLKNIRLPRISMDPW